MEYRRVDLETCMLCGKQYEIGTKHECRLKEKTIQISRGLAEEASRISGEKKDKRKE